MAEFNTLHTISYWFSIVTMAISCIVYEIKRDIGLKSCFFVPLSTQQPQGKQLRIFLHVFSQLSQIPGLLGGVPVNIFYQ